MLLFQDRKVFLRYIANGFGLSVLYFTLTQALSLFIRSKLLITQLAFFPVLGLAFWIHRKNTFRSDDDLFAEFRRFALAQFASFFLISLLLITLFEELGASDQLTYVAIILAKAVYNAIAYGLYVFKPTN